MFARLVSLYQMNTKLMYLRTVFLNFKNIKLATFIAQHESVSTDLRVNY